MAPKRKPTTTTPIVTRSATSPGSEHEYVNSMYTSNSDSTPRYRNIRHFALKEASRREKTPETGAAMAQSVDMIGSELFGGREGEGGKQWNKLKLEEMENTLRYFELKAAQTRLIIEHLKSEEGNVNH